MTPPENVKILLIDDDDIDVRAVLRGFRKSMIGNSIVVANDGREAIDILRGTNGRVRLPRPYVILLDLNMPRMNGMEFLEFIRNDPELHESIIFVLTTSNDDQDMTAAYNKQISGYILKSKAGDDFLRVAQMLGHFIITVQFPPDLSD